MTPFEQDRLLRALHDMTTRALQLHYDLTYDNAANIVESIQILAEQLVGVEVTQLPKSMTVPEIPNGTATNAGSD